MSDKAKNPETLNKRQYITPRLTEFGAVARLSQSGATTLAENSGHGMKPSTCL